MAHNEYYTYKETPINGNIMMSLQVFDIITKKCVSEDSDLKLDTSKGFSMSGSKNLINCTIKDNEVYINLHVRAQYGINITERIRELQTKIASTIKQITNVDVKAIDIAVDNVEF